MHGRRKWQWLVKSIIHVIFKENGTPKKNAILKLGSQAVALLKLGRGVEDAVNTC